MILVGARPGPADPESFYVSARSVDDLRGDLSSVRPAIDPARVPGGPPELYLSSSSCLGSYGPLGAYGPLGVLGPLGDDVWNPAYWISGAGDWREWSEQLADLDGPLSAEGPLGPDGPVAEDHYYGSPLYDQNHFAKQLQGGGVWTALGPIGPLGALGPLGPLGPVGAHGLARTDDGDYVDGDGGAIVRAVSVPFGDGARSYELVEHYTERRAAELPDNDTSFVVAGRVTSFYDADTFAFTSAHDQLVTVVVVPEKSLDDFDLLLVDDAGDVVASSRSRRYIDWIQLDVPAGTRLHARVVLASSRHFLGKTYRLYVTGSTPALRATDITGDHQVPCPPLPGGSR